MIHHTHGNTAPYNVYNVYTYTYKLFTTLCRRSAHCAFGDLSGSLLTPYNGIHLCAGCEAFRCCIHRARYLDSIFYIESFANSICRCMTTALLLKFRFCSILFSLTVATSCSTECLCVSYHHHIDDDDDFSPLQQKASLLNLF